MRTDKRILVVGFDGASFPLIDSWMSEGKLKNMLSIRDRGTFGILESTVPPITFPAVPSFITGKNPGNHGVCSFFKPQKDSSMGLLNSKSVKDEFWTVSGMSRLRKVLINLPLTYPAKPLNGYVVTDFMTPDKSKPGFIYPPDRRQHYKDVLDEYIIDVEPRLVRGLEREHLSVCTDAMWRRLSLIKKALRIENWDLAIVYFTFLDRVQHSIFDLGKGKLLEEAYGAADEVLGDLLDFVDDDTDLFVFSDHGFGPSQGRFHPNSWLERNGYLAYKAGSRRRSLGAFARKNQSNPLLSWAASKVPADLRKKLLDRLDDGGPSYDMGKIDWERTVAYATINGIYITSADTARKAAIQSDIIEKMKHIRDPQSNRILEVRHYLRDNVYSGAQIEKMPDLMYEISGYSYEPFATFDAVEPIQTFNNMTKGWHRPEGIYFAMGKDIKRGYRNDARIIDLAPTILHLFGSDVPRDMDGSVLKGIFKDSSEPSRRDVVFIDDERSKLTKRVRMLKAKGAFDRERV